MFQFKIFQENNVFLFIIILLNLNNLIADKLYEKNMSTFYNIPVKDINGDAIDLSKLKGKYILLVNVASRCGYTSQYEGLQKLYNASKNQIEIIGVPCNDFGRQEPGTESMIKEFCSVNYGVNFTMTEKQSTKSGSRSKLFDWLSDPKLNGWNSDLPSWNFCKYIINSEGELTHFFPSNVKPGSSKITEALNIYF